MATTTRKKKTTKKKTPTPTTGKLDYTPVFAFHGVPLESSGTQFVGDCPFCEYEGKFFVNEETGQWQCKHGKCGEAGNVYTFLHKRYLALLNTPNEKKLASLAANRGLDSDAVTAAGVVYDANNGRYLVPVYNRNHALVNLKAYSSSRRKFYNTPAPIIAHLYGAQKLANAEDTVLICEGEWDAIALEWCLEKIPKARRPKMTIVAVPGADAVTPKIFTDKVIELLEGKQVVLLFDNDEAGNRGAAKLAGLLSSNGVTDLWTVNWPSSFPEKYDVSDHITKLKLPPEKAWQQLFELVEPVSDELKISGESSHIVEDLPKLPPRTKFSQVISDFRRHGVHINKDLEGGLALTAAVGISNELPGDPLWLFLVGASGSGKSLLLESAIPSRSYVYRTTTTYSDLISGARGEGEERSSLIHELVNKTFLIKDYTAVLTLPVMDLQKLNGLLRDAYDGSIARSYGNGKMVTSEGYFSIIAGCTPKIHSHMTSNLGERFLKYEIAPPQGLGNRRAIEQAISGGLNSAGDVQNRKFRQSSFCSFVDGLRTRLSKTVKKQDYSSKTLNSVIALSRFVAICRSVVERDRHGALLYEASPEAATRLAKQLIKLPQALCHVYGLRKPDANVLSIVRKTAWDSAYSRIRSIYDLLYHETPNPESPASGLTANEIAESLTLPKTTTKRTLDDMLELKIIRRRNKNRKNGRAAGRPEMVYSLVKEAVEIYETCGFN